MSINIKTSNYHYRQDPTLGLLSFEESADGSESRYPFFLSQRTAMEFNDYSEGHKHNVLHSEVESSLRKTPILKAAKSLPLISLFNKPLKNLYPRTFLDLPEIYNLIKSSEYKLITEELRAITDKDARKKLRETVCNYVTFSGVFCKRGKKSLFEGSGLLVIEFKDIINTNVIKSQLLKDKKFETELMYTYPTGTDLTWVISNRFGDYPYAKIFDALDNYLNYFYGFQIDMCGNDVSRPSFLFHDPTVYINPKYFENETS